MDPVWILLQTPIFGGLARGDVEELLPHLTERSFDAGETVWLEGDPVDAMYVVAEGTLKSYRLSPDGGEVIVALHAAVGVTGEIGLFHASGVRQVNLSAMTASTCLLLRRRPLVDFLSGHPVAMEQLLEQISDLAVRVAYSFTGMAFDDIRHRAARTLLSLAEEFGEPVPGGTRIRLELSQRTLAALVAASRENVNRSLAPLFASGAISQDHAHFVIHDIAALEASSDQGL